MDKNQKSNIIALGDTHGQEFWQTLVDKPWDRFIFIGDYFDSFHVHGRKQILNFQEIIKFKEKNPEKVILLFGNHEFHYLEPSDTSQWYSGFQYEYSEEITGLIHDALDKKLLQVCYVDGKYLFVHAGVTKTWAKDNKIDLGNIESSINNLFNQDKIPFGFHHEGVDRTGDDIFQGPLWVRPDSLRLDQIDNFTQVIGHTKVRNIEITEKLIFIDTLESVSKEYLEINDGIPSSHRLTSDKI